MREGLLSSADSDQPHTNLPLLPCHRNTEFRIPEVCWPSSLHLLLTQSSLDLDSWFHSFLVTDSDPTNSESSIQDLRGWTLSSRRRPISASATIDAWTERHGIQPPEMVFFENLFQIQHPRTGLRIDFTASDALLLCRRPPSSSAAEGKSDPPPEKGSEATGGPGGNASPAPPAQTGPIPAPVKCKSAKLWQAK